MIFRRRASQLLTFSVKEKTDWKQNLKKGFWRELTFHRCESLRMAKNFRRLFKMKASWGSMFSCSTLLRPSLHSIWKIFWISTRWVWFLVSTVYELSSKEERNSWLSCDSNPGQLGGKQECYLCATQYPKSLGKIKKDMFLLPESIGDARHQQTRV